MKTTHIIIILLVIVILGFGGYWLLGNLKSQNIKKQGIAIEAITVETMNLETVQQNQTEISLLSWENLSKNSAKILEELKSMDIVSDSFKEKIDKFYGAQAQDKYQEARYMQVLIDAQRQLDLKNQQPKSKDQIKLILAELNNIQAEINQNNLSLGPKFNVFHDKFEQESLIYKNNLTELVSRMNDKSPSVQLSSAGLDKAIDELKLEIANSLNEWVNLQFDIKDQIREMINTNWVKPF